MSLEFRHIAHAYGDVQALSDISFTAPAGEITCLLGSSGCGKSTLLNLAAGLLPVQKGGIFVDGELLAEDGFSPPPEDRPIGLVFQDGALFPHMTIAKNVAFGLGKADRQDVEDWLDQVGLSGLGGRFPHELSGGQQQRAALARAMAPGPRVLLMDEPFASVDIVLRRKLRRDCRMLLRQRGATAILVTHDPDEALDIADRIAVMEAGRIIQLGTPHDLRETPQAASVGAIFGGAQIIKAKRRGDILATRYGDWPLGAIAGVLPDSAHLDLLVHAEKLDCEPDEDGLAVRDVHPVEGGNRVLLAGNDGAEITARTSGAIDPAVCYRLVPRPQSVRAFASK